MAQTKVQWRAFACVETRSTVRVCSPEGDVLRSFVRGRVTAPILLSSFATAALLLSPPSALGAEAPLFTSLPAVQGEAVVGATLTAVAAWTGDPAPTAKYSWRRCRATGNGCDPIIDATAAHYVVTAADLGFRLGVRIALKNKAGSIDPTPSVTTDVVVAASTPVPTPLPGPPPPPDPDRAADPTPEPVTQEERTSFTEPVAPIVSVSARATLLRPFPVVRIRGYFKTGGVRVTLLSVNAPRSARITVRCVGRGCPMRTLSLASAPARLRPFERFLPAGTVLQVRVTRAGSIGKYASFLIRAHSAPLRTDLCLLAGRAKPAACPT
jgi:hypothetical protein